MMDIIIFHTADRTHTRRTTMIRHTDGGIHVSSRPLKVGKTGTLQGDQQEKKVLSAQGKTYAPVRPPKIATIP